MQRWSVSASELKLKAVAELVTVMSYLPGSLRHCRPRGTGLDALVCEASLNQSLS